MCIHTMIKYYKWLFQVAEDEINKDEVSSTLVLNFVGKELSHLW